MLKRLHLHNRYIITLSIMSLITSMVSPPIAMATSPADDDVHILEGIQVGGAGDSCTYEDRTQNWMDSEWWKSSWNYQYNYDNAQAHMNDFIEELNNNIAIGQGWAVTQNTNPNNGSLNMITVQTFSPTATLTMQNNGVLSSSSSVRSMDVFLNPGAGCRVQNWNTGATNVSAYGNSIAGSNGYFLVASDNIVYPPGYEGPQIPSTADVDGDDLAAALELTQGTSDVIDHEDTDGDGIDDLKESRWYSNRNDVFCKSDLSACTYPNPIQKDLYVEIDWMNDGTQDYKPTAGQLGTVTGALENKGIATHFDIGQFGGGEPLPSLTESLVFESTDDEIDFYDLKNGTSSMDRQFAENRKGIWRYMITGKNFIKKLDGSTPIPGSTGAAYPGDDDSMISMEMLEADFTSTTARNKAVSGTILHELGHNLCLSRTEQYNDQSSECIYEGIDNASGNPPLNSPDAFYNLVNYESVMNYRYQLADQDDMGSVDYSDNTHGMGDHDDWGAVMTGIDDFIHSSDPGESTFQRRGGIIRQLQD